MNKTIILTKAIKDAEKLKDTLVALDNSFLTVPCFTKDTLKVTDEVETIFSTWYMPLFTEYEVMQQFPALKSIYYAAGTVEYFAAPFLKNNVRIFSASDANSIPVAEFVTSQIVLANKGYFQAQKGYKWPIWKRGFNNVRKESELKFGNYGAKVGIIGCGAIGSKIVELLKPYSLSVIVHDPFLSEERIKLLGVEKSSLEHLFSSCDVVSNHLPDNRETKNIINYNLLSLMKPTATFINTGRGNQVVEKDLAKVMRKNHNMCALLDVTSHEPLFPWSPLYFCKNVFLTPHIAGSLSNEFVRMVEYMIQAYRKTNTEIINPC